MSLGISYSGYRSGFPFPIHHAASGSEVGAGTRYPVGMSLTHAAEIYWRWRDFNVYIEIVDYLTADGPEFGTDYADNEDLERSFTDAATFTDNVEPNEMDLNNGVTLELDYNYLTIEPGAFMMFDYEPYISVGFGDPESDPQRLKYYDGLFYPKMQYEADGGGGLGSQVSSFINYGDPLPFPDTTSSNYNGKIVMQDGTEYDFPIWLTVLDDYTASRVFRLSCGEYYSYGGKFDITDGSRL